jgi:hypothetical protein
VTAAARTETLAVRSAQDRPGTGPKGPYDLVKEFVIALVVVGVLSVVLALILSSPDEKGVTLQRWARQDRTDFVATAVSELAATSTAPRTDLRRTRPAPDSTSFSSTWRTGSGCISPSTPPTTSCWPPCHRRGQPGADRSPGGIPEGLARTATGLGVRLRQSYRAHPDAGKKPR